MSASLTVTIPSSNAATASVSASASVSPAPDPIPTEQQNMRKTIISIQKDPRLSAKEKQTKIFSLFNNKAEKGRDPCAEYQKTPHTHGTCPGTCSTASTAPSISMVGQSRAAVKSLLTSVPVTSSEDKYILSSGGAWIQIPCSQLHPTSQSGKCEHYTRGCCIYTECCRQFFSCRLCHDQATDHTLDPKDVKVIRCHNCSQIQLASNQCMNQQCKTIFGEYYCAICKLWSTGVDIYHCHKCGDICLRGRQEIDNKHCDTCGYCMPISRFNEHACCKYGDEICAMCLEDFKGCLGDVERTKCGHLFHMSCMEKYIGHDVCCPICRKTLFDMSERWDEIDLLKITEVIPDDFKSWRIRFQCNDCLSTNLDKFSIYGNKCPTCSSYNTTQQDILRNETEAEDTHVDAEDFQDVLDLQDVQVEESDVGPSE